MKKLLVLEDEDVILKALKRLLERNHYEVQTATTVEEAIQAEPQSFDLILADLRLPGAEGTAIIPTAGAVPVVIMTSHASVRSAVDAMRSGAMDYIAKPFDHDELLDSGLSTSYPYRALQALVETLGVAIGEESLCFSKVSFRVRMYACVKHPTHIGARRPLRFPRELVPRMNDH